MSEGVLRRPENSDQGILPDAGSFRDRENRVYRVGDRIFRGISAGAYERWKDVSSSQFYNALLTEAKIIPTTDVSNSEIAHQGDLAGWPAVLSHETIPFVSYPYEWSFSMLKDSALLHLDILERAIPQGWTLKDSSAYNIQWRACRPVFIDTPSFDHYNAGDPWRGYRQFCMMFLYPLMLKAYLGVDFGPLLRSYLDGIDPAVADKFLWRGARFRKGVFSHVHLHSRMQERAATRELDEARRLTEEAAGAPEATRPIRHSEAMVLGLIQGLRAMIEKMRTPKERTTWSGYESDHSYSDNSHQKKKEFVDRHAAARDYKMIWDIGCNTGTFSRICESHARHIISIDGDSKAIDRLYQQEKPRDAQRILPLIIDLTNVSPNQGWRGAERKSLESRGKPDLIVCLALIHHMVISANIPMAEFIDWLAGMGGDIIIEFVTAEDSMARMLLRNKVNQYQDYTLTEFERLITRKFAITDSEELKGGHRKIYFLSRL